jgi:hypothetical protein
MSRDIHATAQLQSPENVRIANREWKAERIGWTVLALIVMAGLCGALGPGLLSRRTVQSAEGRLHVEHYAIVHHDAPAELLIQADRGETAGAVRLWFSRSLTDTTTLISATPQPASMEFQADGLTYTFTAATRSPPAVQIVYRFKPMEFGRLQYEIRMDPAAAVQIQQFVLP